MATSKGSAGDKRYSGAVSQIGKHGMNGRGVTGGHGTALLASAS